MTEEKKNNSEETKKTKSVKDKAKENQVKTRMVPTVDLRTLEARIEDEQSNIPVKIKRKIKMSKDNGEESLEEIEVGPVKSRVDSTVNLRTVEAKIEDEQSNIPVKIKRKIKMAKDNGEGSLEEVEAGPVKSRVVPTVDLRTVEAKIEDEQTHIPVKVKGKQEHVEHKTKETVKEAEEDLVKVEEEKKPLSKGSEEKNKDSERSSDSDGSKLDSEVIPEAPQKENIIPKVAEIAKGVIKGIKDGIGGGKSTVSNIKKLFSEYEKAYNELDFIRIGGFYSDIFLIASPGGSVARNKAEYLRDADKLAENCRNAGQASVKILLLEETRISNDYFMVKVRWGAAFMITSVKVLEYDVTYIVHNSKPEPQITMLIFHQDEQQLVKDSDPMVPPMM